MNFLVIGKDYPNVLERRMACRADHVKTLDDLKAKGHMQYGGAMLNDEGQMIGSAVICNFASKEELQELWLNTEPYILGQVWETIEIHPYNIGPSFVS